MYVDLILKFNKKKFNFLDYISLNSYGKNKKGHMFLNYVLPKKNFDIHIEK